MPETAVTLGTTVRPLARVPPAVLYQAGSLGEALPALPAGKGPLPAVRPPVSRQRCPAPK